MAAEIIDITDQLNAFTKSREKVDVRCIDGNLVVWRSIARKLPNYIDDEDDYVEIFDRFVDEVKKMIVDIRESKKDDSAQENRIDEIEKALRINYSITKQYLYDHDCENNKDNEANYLSNFFKRVDKVCVSHHSILEKMYPCKRKLERSDDILNNKLINILVQDRKTIFPLLFSDIILGFTVDSDEENVCRVNFGGMNIFIPISAGQKFYPMFIPLCKLPSDAKSSLTFNKHIKRIDYKTFNFSSRDMFQKFVDSIVVFYAYPDRDRKKIINYGSDGSMWVDYDREGLISFVNSGSEVFLKHLKDESYIEKLPGYFDE